VVAESNAESRAEKKDSPGDPETPGKKEPMNPRCPYPLSFSVPRCLFGKSALFVFAENPT
jgi:hypothetical protein